MAYRKLIPFLILAALVTVLDLASKSWVFSRLPNPHDHFTVIDGVFDIIHHTNTGGMWGVGQDWNPWILRIVRMGAVAVIFVILAQTPASDRISVWALGLVMGGAIGNIHDSLAHDAVRDFLKFDLGFPPFDPFPTFNVADSAICVGVFLLAIQMLFFSSPPVAEAEAAPEKARDANAGNGTT